ncbi:methylated-DNA--[protein]-cysteine S-methyltransferase [Frondihabitans australicus]|uniref:Methylated-DNA--protein-cysteine methyltransferase n=1 Tax=Frondihabitans australicus TaxID=386892 RepID=A0A495IL35_9MICO|nr:methylated-DNA--[protein]-cysteine S-methyltransferase [Frondihabitans australicus]RKR75991.1 methylated-DNA-[protein]-cysteine S-methyltransferase [Frondihabitans australicus]
MSYTVIDSPLGELTLVADDAGALRALYMVEHRHAPDVSTFGERLAGDDADEVFGEVTRQLGEYFAGERTTFDLPTAPAGTPFQLAVWEQLRAIPYGETRTYGELAVALGNPKAVRAVGLANGRNPLSIIVPCHRVIGASGAMTGFGGGIERKEWLLGHEGYQVVPSQPALFA